MIAILLSAIVLTLNHCAMRVLHFKNVRKGNITYQQNKTKTELQGVFFANELIKPRII